MSEEKIFVSRSVRMRRGELARPKYFKFPVDLTSEEEREWLKNRLHNLSIATGLSFGKLILKMAAEYDPKKGKEKP